MLVFPNRDLFETKTAQTLTKSMDEEDFSKTLVADGRCLNIDVYHPEWETIIIASWFVT